MGQVSLAKHDLPAIPLAQWEDTRLYWQLMSQILGKIKLALNPKVNHWWHIPLYITPRGTTTGTIPYKDTNFDIQLDLTDHRLILRTGTGQTLGFELEGRPIADFYTHLFDMLRSVGIEVEIDARPYKCKSTEPFPTDRIHATYDPDAAHRAWKVLRMIEPVFQEFRGHFIGKCSPVHQFWHSFDLACTRFSGRRAPDAGLTDPVAKEAYSHECISAGFWFGDDTLPLPAFYCYTWPAPRNLDIQHLEPHRAFWREIHGSPQATLLYDDLRKMHDPHTGLRHFLQSSYESGAILAGWNRSELERYDSHASAHSPSP